MFYKINQFTVHTLINIIENSILRVEVNGILSNLSFKEGAALHNILKNLKTIDSKSTESDTSKNESSAISNKKAVISKSSHTSKNKK